MRHLIMYFVKHNLRQRHVHLHDLVCLGRVKEHE